MDGRPCGFGIMRYSYSLPGSMGSDYEDGTYEGQWKAGKREGSGTLQWQDGTCFTGIWKNGMRLNGEMKMSNGFIYKGTFQEDKLHGLCKLLIGNGVIFEGQFQGGFCGNVGKLMYPNGDLYYG